MKTNLKKILFPFANKKYDFLEQKWLHRLLKIITILLLIGGFFGIRSIYIGEYSSLEANKYTITIVNDLQEFTINNPQYINTIPEFIKLAKVLGNNSYILYNIGCFQNDTRKFIEIKENDLNQNMCNADIPNNIDGMINSLGFVPDTEIENFKKDLLANYNEDLKKGINKYCYLPIALNCSPKDIFIYERNRLYYIQGIIYSILRLYLIFLILQFIYFKGVIYIIYGNKKK